MLFRSSLLFCLPKYITLSQFTLTDITKLFPVFTGFGTMLTVSIFGTDKSRRIVLETVVVFPALSFAVTSMVLPPSLRVTVFSKLPAESTATSP